MSSVRRTQAPDPRDVVERIAAERRIPRATYRLQLRREFSFKDAARLVPYLDELGVSDVYVSPIFKARAGSSHGYDVVDHGQINPELGGEEGLNALVKALHERGMGLIVDMVPNHMAINEPTNRWWMDVLENGPASMHASFFDIDWDPVKAELAGKVLLPILGDQYGAILERGELKLGYAEGAFFVHYWEHELPVSPDSYDQILERHLADVTQKLGENDSYTLELLSIITAVRHLPHRTQLSPQEKAERNREKEVIKRRLGALYSISADVRRAVEATIVDYNGGPDRVELMDDLLTDQPHRLAFWQVAAEEINYRRFFDINDMAAIRVERPEVFAATHDLLLRLMAEGKVTGARIDHPDGLWAPAGYFRSLQDQYVARRARHLNVKPADGSADPEASDEAIGARLTRILERATGPTQWPMYVVAEKILSEREGLPREWAVEGTTGYDFLNLLNGLFVDIASAERLDRAYRQFSGMRTSFANLTNTTKKMIMLVSLSSEINALSHELERISDKNRAYRDFTLNSLTFAIREVMAALAVYRTYYAGVSGQSASDEAHIRAATAEAKRRNPRTAASLFDYVEDTLLLRNLDSFREEDRQRVSDFVMKFQQVSGPVMAKGVEDTAFYQYMRLVSLNEVGGDPSQFGIPVAEFHRRNARRLRRSPHSMLATTTHDTKRSEDVRARINVLSEQPAEWREAVTRWSRMNAPKKARVNGGLAPDTNDEYLLYQTLVGAWPIGRLTAAGMAELRERIVAYMAKAIREAKVHTSWVNANEGYERAVEQFVRAVLTDDQNDEFVQDFVRFQQPISVLGAYNTLAQTLLKLTAPGVPDLYQGTELWALSLVDPDNRRPVDFDERRRLLGEMRGALTEHGEDRAELARSFLDTIDDGRAKLFVIHQALECRRELAELFSEGSYVPIRTRGPHRRQVCAFARVHGSTVVVAVAPRLISTLTEKGEKLPIGPDTWADTELILPAAIEAERYRDVLTGEQIAARQEGQGTTLSLGQALAHFPVALLRAETRRRRRAA